MAGVPAPNEGIVLTHFIVSEDVERSRRFYTDVLGDVTVLRVGFPLGRLRRGHDDRRPMAQGCPLSV